jgi:hypothetical protein
VNKDLQTFLQFGTPKHHYYFSRHHSNQIRLTSTQGKLPLYGQILYDVTTNSTFPLTSKSRKWFSTLCLQKSVCPVTIRLWDIVLCITAYWTKSHTTDDVCIFATSTYTVFWYICFVFLYPAATLTYVAFPWNRDFTFILSIFIYNMFNNSIWYNLIIKRYIITIIPLSKLEFQS